MSKFISAPLVAALCFVGSLAPAWAEERASLDEAKVMALKAAAYLKANLDAPQKVFDEFNTGWRDRDLYVTVRSKDGTQIAHGTQPNNIGKNHIDLRDVDGKLLVREIVACTSQCWVHYKWKNHANGAIEQKSSYVVAVGEYRVLVGAYKP